MLKIRLQRFGKKNQPHYRVVLTDSRSGTQSGKFIETLGWYNPREHTHELKREQIEKRLNEGAQASGTVHNLLVKEGIVRGKKIDVAPRIANKKGGNEKEVQPEQPIQPIQPIQQTTSAIDGGQPEEQAVEEEHEKEASEAKEQKEEAVAESEPDSAENASAGEGKSAS